jgi:hypothetical protein
MASNRPVDWLSPRSAVRFRPEDLALFRTAKMGLRRVEDLQDVLPRLNALLEEALCDVRALYGVEPLDDSIVSLLPTDRKHFATWFDTAGAGLTGQHVSGKWHGATRRDGSLAPSLPYRLGAVLDEDGLSVEFRNHWLTVLNAASFQQPLKYLESFAPDLDLLFREWGVEFTAYCDDRPFKSVAQTLAAVRSSGEYSIYLTHRPRAGSAAAQSTSMRSALVRLYPIYDSFIQLAKGERPRLNTMLDCLGERMGKAAKELLRDVPPEVARRNREGIPMRHGAPRPFVGVRATSVLDDGSAVTYALELQGASEDAFKIGCAGRHEDRVQTFNQAAMPQLGGISYVPILSEPWDNRDDAFDMEQEVLNRLKARRHPANQEVVTGVTRSELEDIWAMAARKIRRRRR